MADFFLKVLNMSLSASVMVGIVLLLWLFLGKAPKWIRMLLWGMVALRLVCPVTIQTDLSRIPKSISTGQAISQLSEYSLEHHREEAASSAPALPVDSPDLRPDSPMPSGTVPEESPSLPVKTVGSAILPALSLFWFLGILAMLQYAFLSYDRLRSRVRDSVLYRDNISFCPAVTTPFILGIFHPWIYLPPDLPEPDIYHVIAHERMHLQRKDHLWKPLGYLILTIHWFNPLIWLSYALFSRDIELACDERAIKHMCPEQRANYSQALLNCSIHSRRISPCPLAFGEVSVKDRVRNVLTYKKPAFRLILVSLLLCLTVAACFLTDPKASPQLQWLQELSAQKVDYIEYRCYDAPEDHQYRLYQGSSLPEALEVLNSFDGEPCDPMAPQSLLGSTCTLTIVLHDGQTHTVANFGNRYLSIDGHFFEDTQGLLNQSWDSLWYGITYLPARENTDFGVSIEIESVSPTGATILLNQYDDSKDMVLFGGNDYFLQAKTDDGWQDLATIQDATFTTEAYDIANIRRHKIDWEWLYGTLPGGHYRIGKTIHLWQEGNTRNYGTVYAEFTLDNPPLQITAENVTSEGLTIVYTPADVLMSSAVATDLVYWLESFDGSQWIKLEPTQNIEIPLPVTGTTIRSIITEDPDRHELIWTHHYGSLPAGTYRIGVPMYFRGAPLQDNALYAEFTIPATFQLPLGTATVEAPGIWDITSRLSIESLTSYADFVRDGGGYTFFPDEAEALISILRSLTEADFLPSPGVEPVTSICLQEQGLTLWLHSDGTYVEFACDSQTTGLPVDTRYAVKNKALNTFIDAINRNSAAQSTYETYDHAPLTELSPHYTLEEAEIDNVVTFIDGDIRHNSQVWEDFLSATEAYRPATVRLFRYYHADGEYEAVKRIYDLEYDGTQYILHGIKDGTPYHYPFQYLRREQVSIYPVRREFDEYICYFLTNSRLITLKNLDDDRFTDPTELDQYAPIIVYSDLITYPVHPEIPTDLTYAKLDWDNETVSSITDTGKLESLYSLLSKAEKQTSGDRSYAPGLTLSVYGASGEVVKMHLDSSNDLIRIGVNAWYDYGPNTDARRQLYSLFGFSIDPAADFSEEFSRQLHEAIS